MRRQIKQTIVLILALVFLALGLVGLVLPVLQGVLFLVLGLVLLSFYFTTLDGRLTSLLARHPKTQKLYRSTREFLRKYLE